MSRLGAIFIVICMVLIAASIGAALYLLAGLHAAESMIVAVAVLTGLAIYNAVASRLRDRFDVGTQNLASVWKRLPPRRGVTARAHPP